MMLRYRSASIDPHTAAGSWKRDVACDLELEPGNRSPRLERQTADHHVLASCRCPSDQGAMATVPRAHASVNRKEGYIPAGTPSCHTLAPQSYGRSGAISGCQAVSTPT